MTAKKSSNRSGLSPLIPEQTVRREFVGGTRDEDMQMVVEETRTTVEPTEGLPINRHLDLHRKPARVFSVVNWSGNATVRD
jgi:hypothetical protein